MCIAIGTKVTVDPRGGYPATIGMLATVTEFAPYRGQGGYYITWDYGRPKEMWETGGGWVMASLVAIAPEDKQEICCRGRRIGDGGEIRA